MNKLEKAVYTILKEIGDNPNREGLKETPARVARMYKEICYGLNTEVPPFKIFSSTNNQMVIKKNIYPVFSLCEHHLVPIIMRVHFAYIPLGKVVGISKIIRRIKWWAARPQIQENLTEQIVDDFEKHLHPLGVGCVIEGRHYCEYMRGVKTPSITITSAMRGVFLSGSESRMEFLSLINNSKDL